MNDQKENRASENWYGMGPRPFSVSAEREQRIHYKIRLFGVIEDASQFEDALEVLERATPDDTVTVFLSSPGGSVDATDTFLQAMQDCAAPVHIVASGGCHSAATIILLSAPSFTLSDNFNSLVHNGSCGSYGDFNKWHAAARFTAEFMAETSRKTYAGFMTDEEINMMLAGKDFWMGPQEFCDRYERRNELLAAKEQKDALEELETAQERLTSLIAEVKTPKPRSKKATKTAA
jgi:ATP-dependent protease ClpP protease subunit